MLRKITLATLCLAMLSATLLCLGGVQTWLIRRLLPPSLDLESVRIGVAEIRVDNLRTGDFIINGTAAVRWLPLLAGRIRITDGQVLVARAPGLEAGPDNWYEQLRGLGWSLPPHLVFRPTS